MICLKKDTPKPGPRWQIAITKNKFINQLLIIHQPVSGSAFLTEGGKRTQKQNIMKTITIFLSLLIFTFAMQFSQAQEESETEKTERITQQKEQIIAEERAALKKTVEGINQRLERNEVTREEANTLKEAAAKKHALNIENRIAILENESAWETRNEDWDEKERLNKNKDEEDYKHRDIYSRTSTHLVMAAGFNNAIENGESFDFNDSDFKLAGSRFFEIGIAWRTRVFENSNWLRFRYGFSFQFNGLKPTDNRVFVEDEDLTYLVEYPIELNKSKFRMDNLVFPVYFEFGPSRRVDTDSKTWFSTANKFKMGVGGYAGFNIGERQKLKYEENGDNVKVKNKGDFNTNDFVYGLSAYMGWGDTGLYVKYDLNPIFQEPNAELNNVSVGLRFDLN